MDNRRLLKLGIIGAIISAVCCFTPLLVVLLGTVGLSAAIAWLDVVLLPLLGGFVALTLYAFWLRQRHSGKTP